LKNEGSGRGLLDLASVRGKRRGEKTSDQPDEISALANQKGVPLNVSFAKPADTPHKKAHEIVLAPQSREKVGVLMQAADVSADDAAHLEQALGRKDLVPGDNLVLLLDQWHGSDMVMHQIPFMDGQTMVFSARMIIRDFSRVFLMMLCCPHRASPQKE